MVSEQQLSAELYFFHGWGCDGSAWHKWLPAIDKRFSYHIFDRGYFGNERSVKLSHNLNTKTIVIAHSFGLHFIPSNFFKEIDLLILVSSFGYFHEKNFNGKLSQKSITRMKQQLVQDPTKLLQNFYLKCGLIKPKASYFLNINNELLYDDLSQLDTQCFNLAQLECIPQIIFLHGGKDKIVNQEHSNFMHQQLPNSHLFIKDLAEHALPFSQAKWCFSKINETQNVINKAIFKKTISSDSYESIASGFSRRAMTYEQAAQAQKHAATRLAERIDGQFNASHTTNILEIGCGTGILSKRLVELCYSKDLYFVDPAKDMLSLCNRNLTQTLSPQLTEKMHFIHSTVEEYLASSEFRQSKYALIASSFVFQWLYDLKSVIDRLIERLVPDGQLFFSLPIAGSFPQWQKLCTNLNLPFTMNQLPKAEEIKSSIDINKASLECEEYDYAVSFENALHFFRHLKLLGANTKKFIPTHQLSSSDFRLLIDAWDRQKKSSLGKGDDGIVCTYKILEGTITRR